MCSTAKTSAIAATPSPIAEIVADEKTSRKSRSASAPSLPHRPPVADAARLRRTNRQPGDDLCEHAGVGVELHELRTCTVRRLVREPARTVLADG